MRRLSLLSALPLAALALQGCAQEAAEPETAAAEAAAHPGKLPVSINAAMVGLVDQSADYIWAMGNGDLPKDAHDWDQVRAASYDMILGGYVTKIPGTGEFDEQWTAEENWQQMADELTKIGEDALPLAEAQSTDVEAWRALGNRLIDNCENCHNAFKPDIPSQGIMHEEVSRDAEGVSLFD